MSDYVCRCGVFCREQTLGDHVRYFCPRCNKVVATKVKIQTLEATPKVPVTVATCKCDNCGTDMVDACKARCPNCNWEKPCS